MLTVGQYLEIEAKAPGFLTSESTAKDCADALAAFTGSSKEEIAKWPLAKFSKEVQNLRKELSDSFADDNQE